MVSLSELESISPEYVLGLAAAGVHTTEQLLEQSDTPTKRLHLADEAQVDEHQLLIWLQIADLMRLRDIDERLAALLLACGVSSVPKLAYRNPENLLSEMVTSNKKGHYLKKLPDERAVEAMTAAAKKLPKIVTH